MIKYIVLGSVFYDLIYLMLFVQFLFPQYFIEVSHEIEIWNASLYYLLRSLLVMMLIVKPALNYDWSLQYVIGIGTLLFIIVSSAYNLGVKGAFNLESCKINLVGMVFSGLGGGLVSGLVFWMYS